MRIAIIDLGTNTFHLLIKEVDGKGKSKVIFRHKEFVKLAEKGIEQIHPEAYQRGIDTLVFFASILKVHRIDEVFALGTAALRTASNGNAFVAEATKASGIPIHVIEGKQEATLITRGVRNSVSFEDEPYLIMDIGGGSVEFIIANHEEIFWLKSYPLGAAVLKKRFHKSEPISLLEIEHLKTFLKTEIKDLIEAAQAYNLKTLVGASGTFDTLVDLHLHPMGKSRMAELTYAHVSNCLFYDLMESVLIKNLQQRKLMPGMPEKRSDMIVVASIFIDVVLSELKLERIIQTDYAMKEGIIWSRMQGLNVLAAGN